MVCDQGKLSQAVSTVSGMALAEVPPISDQPDTGFEGLGEAISDAGASLDSMDGFTLGEAVQDLVRLRSRLEAVELHALARYRDSADWAADGYKTPNAWLRDRCRLPKPVAAKRLGIATKLRAMPITFAAFAAGDITIDHADRLGRAAAARPNHFGDAEALLVDNARRLQFADFNKTVVRFEELTDPDPNPEPCLLSGSRKLHASRLLDGMGRIDAWLDKTGFTTFHAELRRLETQLFEADWAEAASIHGDAVSLDQLARTSEQRRADALVLMAERSSATPPDATPPAPLVIVHIDWATFTHELNRHFDLTNDPHDPTAPRLCELADGTAISPALAVELALQGHIRRLVIDAPKIKLEYGRKARFATGVLRELIQIRDRTCTGPGCDTPATKCDIDHIEEWQHGGQTNHDSLNCKCGWHHEWKHRFHITRNPDGTWKWHRTNDPPPAN